MINYFTFLQYSGDEYECLQKNVNFQYVFAFIDLYSQYGFYERLTHLEKAFPGANILLHKVGIMTKVRHILKRLAPEIYCNDICLKVVLLLTLHNHKVYKKIYVVGLV